MMSKDETDNEVNPIDATSDADERLTPLWSNVTTLAGLSFVGVGIILLLTFWLFALVSPPTNPYVDIIGFLVLPGILIVGLIITPVGILLRNRKLRRMGVPHPALFRLPHLDLNDPRQRKAFLVFVAINVFLILPAVAVSSYHGYHFTDSTEFCAKACHSVMAPQGTTHDHSPHARVTCAECHIGAGAGWFVKSKLSGTRQVFAVMFDSYPRPIPPAITSLRPARETCEQCHWPEKFYGFQWRDRVHFSPDEQNTRHEVKMVLKTGGADERIGRAEGIHLHMAVELKIDYVAVDDRLQDIPWVKAIDAHGNESVYRSDGAPNDAPPPDGIRRRLDCMDCHNRAAHKFRPPQEAVDLFLAAGRIDRTLPYIKREAVALLSKSFSNSEAATTTIESSLLKYYQENYPQVWSSREADIRKSIAAVTDLYEYNVFPSMNVNWETYPDNIGHMNTAGCMRCHDGRHIDKQGEAISSDCHVCHSFYNAVGDGSGAIAEGDFAHPMDLSLHKSLRCTQCHTGGPLPLCRDCHQSETWLENYRKGQLRRDTPSLDPDPKDSTH